MNDLNLVIFFHQIAVMLGVALLLGQVMRHLGQAAVLGELIGGVVLGPTLLGTFFPEAYQWLFPKGEVVSAELNSLIQLGMLLFMFVAGLEVDVSHAWEKRKAVILTSLCGVLVPFGLGVGIIFAMPDLQGEPRAVHTWIFAIFFGTALSISALPVILRTLMDLDLLRTEIGIVIMSAAPVSDLVGWTLFAAIIQVVTTTGSVGASCALSFLKVIILSAVIVAGLPMLSRRLLRSIPNFFTWPNGFISMIILTVLIVAGLAEWLGLHPFFSAFLVGIVLREHFLQRGNHIREILYQFALSFFTPLYFVSIGLRANFIESFDFKLVSVVFLIACLGKVIGAGTGAFWGGMSPRRALCVGFGLNARGAMEIVLASVALDMKLIDHRVFVALFIMALLTSMLSGPVIKKLSSADLAARIDTDSAKESGPG